MTLKDRLLEYCQHTGVKISAFERRSGLSNGYFNQVKKEPSRSKISQIAAAFPDLNTDWLLTGEGEMLKNSIQDISTDRQEVTLVPLLPVSAQGGRLNDFVVSVRKEDCEKLISPIKGADFAIMISGDSMAPEYPSGSKVLVKKIKFKVVYRMGKVLFIGHL